MNKQLFQLIRSMFTLKQLIAMSMCLAIVNVPIEILHFIGMTVHIIYESIAYACEELLVHKAGFNKFQAQLLVFYSSLVIAVIALLIMIKNIPRFFIQLKKYATELRQNIILNLRNFWQSLELRQKAKLLMLQFITILGMATLFLV